MYNKHKRDSQFLIQALSLAEQGQGFCAPNPAVGSILVNQMGIVIATGFHTGPGKPHAEVEVLKKVSYQAREMTLYVTLEPCCHWGKTPPCTDAIIQSGLTRVVYGFRDPNPLVIAGQGMQLLKEAGIDCELISLPEIEAFYKSYYFWHKTKKPLVTAKIALSLDGKIAGKDGERVQLTGDDAQHLTHHYRKNTDAILTTAKTIIMDDPQLNARTHEAVIPKSLYVLDSQLSLPREANIFNTTKSITVFHSKTAPKEHQNSLEQKGVRCIALEETSPSVLNLDQAMIQIGNDGVIDLWVEAGGKCFSSLWKNNLIHRGLIYIAPRWFGEGLSAFENNFSLGDLSGSQIKWIQVGNDAVLEIDRDTTFADHLGKDYQAITTVHV